MVVRVVGAAAGVVPGLDVVECCFPVALVVVRSLATAVGVVCSVAVVEACNILADVRSALLVDCPDLTPPAVVTPRLTVCCGEETMVFFAALTVCIFFVAEGLPARVLMVMVVPGASTLF